MASANLWLTVVRGPYEKHRWACGKEGWTHPNSGLCATLVSEKGIEIVSMTLDKLLESLKLSFLSHKMGIKTHFVMRT